MTTVPSRKMTIDTACGNVHVFYRLNGKYGKELKIDKFDFVMSKTGVCARSHLTVLGDIISASNKTGTKLGVVTKIMKGVICSTGDNRTKNNKCCINAIAVGIERFIEILNEEKEDGDTKK